MTLLTDELTALANNVLKAIAKEDEKYFQSHGFYTTKTRAGDCKVLVFEIPEQKEEYLKFRSEQKC